MTNRVKLQLPNTIHHTSTLQIRISDLNYGNHVGNDNVVSMLHEARIQLLQHYNYTELNIHGLGLIMADIMVAYKHQMYYGDVVTIHTYITDLTVQAFNIYYKMLLPNKQNTIAIEAKTGMVFFDYTSNKIAKMPNNFATLFTM